MQKRIELFNTTDNKGYLWGLMNENGIFDGISNTYVTTIKNDLDNQINVIESKINQNDTLIGLNKKVISNMVQIINKYKENTQPIQFIHSIQSTQSTNTGRDMPVTLEEIKLEKQTKFQNNLSTKQQEFDSLILKPKPETIDFTDKSNTEFDDTPIGNEMEQKLAETIAWRENQLNMVLNIQDKKEASQWINKDNSLKTQNSLETQKQNIPPTNESFNNIKHLKIENETLLEDKGIINISSNNNNNKKVSFSTISTQNDNSYSNTKSNVDIDNNNNFLSLLKKKRMTDNKETQTISSDNNEINDISLIKYEMNEIKQLLFQITENYNNLLLAMQPKSNSTIIEQKIDEEIN